MFVCSGKNPLVHNSRIGNISDLWFLVWVHIYIINIYQALPGQKYICDEYMHEFLTNLYIQTYMIMLISILT